MTEAKDATTRGLLIERAPIDVDPHNARSIDRALTTANFQNSNAGMLREQMEEAELSNRLEISRAKATHLGFDGSNTTALRASGHTALANEIDGLARSLDWQRRANAGLFREPLAPQPSREEKLAQDALDSTLKADLSLGIKRAIKEARDIGVELTAADAHAMLVRQSETRAGVERWLPNYARVLRRLGRMPSQ